VHYYPDSLLFFLFFFFYFFEKIQITCLHGRTELANCVDGPASPHVVINRLVGGIGL
jgi:hypothetical protein